MTIYDESQVPDYTLPDPLIMEDGSKVDNAKKWQNQRRAELLEIFRQQVYGSSPDKPTELHYEIANTDSTALDGKAIRTEVTIQLTPEHSMRMLIYQPHEPAKGTFLGLNFRGNHTIQPDPNITISSSWMPTDERIKGIVNNTATEEARGEHASRWDVPQIIERGYAVATIYAGDITADDNDGFIKSILSHFYKAGQTQPEDHEWGAIGSWAWGLSRALDYLETDKNTYGQVAVIGHSRLGKTALWAGAQDERFAMVISNNSGCGGTALSRRRFGETVDDINTRFPHWFCKNFHQYSNNEDALPIDQHQLLALIAPRPLYIASASEDLWCDPYGEFLSAVHADPVYKLLGTSGLPVHEKPAVEQPVMGQIGYHIRSGEHDITSYDWTQYLNFADQHLTGE